MTISRLSQRHVRLLAIVSIVMLLASVFPLYPAAAQDPPTAPPSLDALTISCAAEGTDSIAATIAVSNPQPADTAPSATVEIYANTGGEPMLLSDFSNSGVVQLTDYSVTVFVKLPVNSASVASSVIAKASVAGNDSIAPVWSASTGLPIYASDAGSLCGTAPVDTGTIAPATTDQGAGETLDEGNGEFSITDDSTGDDGTTDDDGTPDDGTDDDGTGDPGDGDTDPLIPAVTSVSIACVTEGADTVNATVAVSNPPADGSGSVSVQLNAGGTPVGTEATASINGANEVVVGVTLPDSDIGATAISASAWITGDTSTAVTTTTDLAIYFSADDGTMLCGTAPTAPGDDEDPGDDGDTDDEDDPGDDEDPGDGEPTEPTVQYATVVNTGGANLFCRAAPVNGSELGRFAPGARVELRGAASNGWYPVVCPNGQDGYSSGDYLKAESTSTPTDPEPGDTSGVAVVNGTGGAGLRCRTTPVNGSVIGVYPDGSRLTMRGAVENGWAPVTCGGQSGWVSTQYARVETGGGTTDPDPGGDPGTGTGKHGTVVNTGGMGLRCRTAPVSGAIIVVVPEGTKLETRGSASNGWYPVICNGQAGYVSGDYFSLSGGGSTTPPPVSGGSKTAMVSGTGGGGLRCRTAPVDGGIITVMPEGALIDVRGNTTNGWAPVKCAGQNGWASAAYLNFNISGGGSGELWMDVNLSTQYMRVYRGNTVIASTYVSTGRRGFDTPTGTYYINHKLRSQTMSGVLGGEYYYVPNVPWVMYFTNRGHAIHGAYWHNNFGHVMSHGCINLPVSFSEWLYSVTPYGARVRIHF